MRPEQKTSYYRPPEPPKEVSEEEIVEKEVTEEIPKEEATEEEKYVCDICGETFDTERGLKIHKARLHGNAENILSEG